MRGSLPSLRTIEFLCEDFAGNARPYFPGLRDVVASPYEMGIGALRAEGQPDRISVSIYPYMGQESVQQYMDPNRFFAGDYPDHFCQPPSLATVQNVTTVIADIKMCKIAEMELTHPMAMASSADTLRRCFKQRANGGNDERDLRAERSGVFDPGESPGSWTYRATRCGGT